MTREYRCRYCRQPGHNIRRCPTYQQQRDAVLAEVGEELRQREEGIRQLEQQLEELRQREGAMQQASLEQIRLAEDLKLEKAKLRAVLEVMEEDEKRGQRPGVRALPAAMGMITSALTFVGQYFDRIPHAEMIGLSLLIFVPGFAIFAAGDWLRGMWTRQGAKARAQELAEELRIRGG